MFSGAADGICQFSQFGGETEVNRPEDEMRKDRPVTVGDPCWRVYLDNFDLLESVSATGMVDLAGTLRYPLSPAGVRTMGHPAHYEEDGQSQHER